MSARRNQFCITRAANKTPDAASKSKFLSVKTKHITETHGPARSPGDVSPGAVRANISTPSALRGVAEQVCTTKGFHGLSDYIQACVRRDASDLGMQ
jgi:hypothetical protein